MQTDTPIPGAIRESLADTDLPNLCLAPGPRPAREELPEDCLADGQRSGRSARVRWLPAYAPGEDLADESGRADQQGGKAPQPRRRDLPQRSERRQAMSVRFPPTCMTIGKPVTVAAYLTPQSQSPARRQLPRRRTPTRRLNDEGQSLGPTSRRALPTACDGAIRSAALEVTRSPGSWWLRRVRSARFPGDLPHPLPLRGDRVLAAIC